MADPFPYELLEDPKELSRYEGWSEPVYRDLLALRKGHMSAREFDRKYQAKKAILVLDMTGFTVSSKEGGALRAFLRILDVQKVCLPALHECGASFIRTFADDMVGLFEDAGDALECAFRIQQRTALFNASQLSDPEAADCCIGIGFGTIYEIGPNRAMGDEMNQASKLGEDTARGGEVLVTEGLYKELKGRTEARFEPQANDDLIFPYYRAIARR